MYLATIFVGAATTPAALGLVATAIVVDKG